MIQRIQTIYLFLASAAFGASFFLPLATASGESSVLASAGDNFFADGVYWAKEFPGGIATIAFAVAALVGIFLYNNRPKQMQLAGSLAVAAILFVALFLALGYYYADKLPEGARAEVALGGIISPLAIPLLWLAYRAIKKDEALVRSSDRLR